MSEVLEKIFVYCPAARASEFLERFIAMHAPGATGKIIPLRAAVNVPGLHLDLHQDVTLVARKRKRQAPSAR